jgi:hypothetical protein
MRGGCLRGDRGRSRGAVSTERYDGVICFYCVAGRRYRPQGTFCCELLSAKSALAERFSKDGNVTLFRAVFATRRPPDELGHKVGVSALLPASAYSRLLRIRGGENFAQFEFVFKFANIRRIRILKMTGKFAEYEFEFQHRNSNSPKRIRIRIESCFQNSRIFVENSNEFAL